MHEARDEAVVINTKPQIAQIRLDHVDDLCLYLTNLVILPDIAIDCGAGGFWPVRDPYAATKRIGG